ncbi:MAG: [protein-PII] uridylyltransferase [Pseudomonadales bacterium]|nr:[protein-PII] uridylyltransferase [Pseudomonadales bacterium]
MKTPLISELKPDNELFNKNDFEAIVATEGRATKAVRVALKKADKVLEQRFLNSENIKLLIRRRAWLLDQLLSWLWNQLDCANSPGISLMAVGGYGRAELHPHSDIDLLILLKSDNTDRFRTDLENFITQLWDIGLEVGHSVRSLNECAELAKDDITIATNLMEARTIAGDPALGEKMLEITGPEYVWPVSDFFEAKWKEQIARHHKHNNTEYNLEPNIKSAPGGLRDIQMIGWVAKRYFGANRLSELVDYNFLTQEEYDILNAGQTFLWEVRYALHLITNRSEDRLLFDYQRSVAEMLGYSDSNVNLAVEKFMKHYYRAALSISQMNDMLLQLFEEAILEADQPDNVIPVNRRFQLQHNHIEVTHEKVFEHTPSALLEIFVILAQNEGIEGIRASTIRLIRDSSDLIDQKFRDDICNISLFMELLRSPYQLYTQFTRMNRLGILGAYIPVFGQVIGQMQYDLFHQYTVDAHTLLVLKNLRKFRHTGSEQEFPMASFLFHRLPKIELIYIAGLFHDLGKGRPGDHSEIGAKDAYSFCEHHRLSRWDSQLVAWLVENHLLMSLTAQKKDVSDPDVIHDFAKQVGHQIRLDYLFVLTIADICGTNPNLWNGWRATLLHQLYSEARRALRRGLENPVDKHDWIEENKAVARRILKRRGIENFEIDEIWEQLGDNYFLRETTGDIARHTEAIINHKDQDGPLVLIGKTDSRRYEGATQVFVYTEDTQNLFAATAAALSQLHLTIADAKIITSTTNFSLDSYVVMEENGNPIDNQERLNQIKAKLIETLSDPEHFPDIVNRRMPRALKHFDIPTEVTVAHSKDNNNTVIEVTTLDRPGLLAEIGRIFLEHGVNILGARIATLGERVEDVFYITDRHSGGIIEDQVFIDRLATALKRHLDSHLDNHLDNKYNTVL